MAQTTEQDDQFEVYGFVPLVYAQHLAEAEYYQTLLEDHDITALIEEVDTEVPATSQQRYGIAVLVPGELLADAKEVLRSREILDESIQGRFEELDDVEDEQDELAELTPEPDRADTCYHDAAEAVDEEDAEDDKELPTDYDDEEEELY